MGERELLPAYLMNGEDELKREYVLERLERRVAAFGDLDFNKDVFTAPAVEASQLVASCNTLPFASEYRLVVVKDADKLAKAAQEAIVAYLADPCPTTVLALTAAKLKKNTRLHKALAKIDAKTVVDCAPKGRRDLPAHVRSIGASKGLTVTHVAAEKLIALVGESTVRLDTELEKIAAAVGKGAVVEVQDVERYVVRTAQVKPWEFTDALCARDLPQALALLAQMDSASPFGLLTMSLNRLRELLIAHDLGSGASAHALAAELKMPDWRVRNHVRWARNFSTDELVAALVAAAEFERRMKSGSDPEMLFEQWACGVCTGSYAFMDT